MSGIVYVAPTSAAITTTVSEFIQTRLGDAEGARRRYATGDRSFGNISDSQAARFASSLNDNETFSSVLTFKRKKHLITGLPVRRFELTVRRDRASDRYGYKVDRDKVASYRRSRRQTFSQRNSTDSDTVRTFINDTIAIDTTSSSIVVFSNHSGHQMTTNEQSMEAGNLLTISTFPSARQFVRVINNAHAYMSPIDIFFRLVRDLVHVE